MRTGKQKRAKERGKVIVNFEWNQEWDDSFNKLAEIEERSKSGLIRHILKEYTARKGYAPEPKKP